MAVDVRIVPDASNPQDLRIVVNGECQVKIYGEDAATPRHGLANFIAVQMSEVENITAEINAHLREANDAAHERT